MKPQVLLVLAVLAVSTAAPLIRWAAPASPLLVAAGRVGLAAVVLSILAGRDLAALRALTSRERLLAAASGVLLAAHFGVWITSLYYTSTAASVALVATQPAFAGLFGWLLLREGIDRREWLGIAVAAVGCAILAGGDLGGAHGALLGDALALAGAVTAAGYFVVGRRLRAAVPLAAYLAAVNLIAGSLLWLVALAAGARVTGLMPHAYLAIALAGLVPSVLGHTLLNWSVRRVRVHLVSLAILGEPLGASLITWVAFGERPPVHAVLGGAVILAGIGLGFVQRGPRRAAAAPSISEP